MTISSQLLGLLAAAGATASDVAPPAGSAAGATLSLTTSFDAELLRHLPGSRRPWAHCHSLSGGRLRLDGPLVADRPGLLVSANLAQVQRLERDSGWILPLPPHSAERQAPIEALRKRATALASAFAPHVHRNPKGEVMPYRLYTPAGLARGRRYPLVVFLHGAGGSGTDNMKQLRGANVFGALAWTLPEIQKRHPAYVLAPQSDVNWACVIVERGKPARLPADLEWCPTGSLGAGAAQAFEIIDALLAGLPINPQRIYVTGHSMGGAGTWHMIAHRPGFFAAAVPVCGHPDPATAPDLVKLPIWNFHGEADEVEPVETSRRMIDALRRAGGQPRHTEYAGVGHDVFMWAYTEPALLDWLFAQKR